MAQVNIKHPETFLPRVLAAALLVINVAMLAPIGAAVIAIARGANVPAATWMIPLIIMATGATLTWLLSRRQVSLQLFLTAFALWILAASYFLVRFVRLP